MKADWKWAAIAALGTALAVVCIRQRSGQDEPAVKVERVVDTVKVQSVIREPQPLVVVVADSIPDGIDTAALIKDYFSKKQYVLDYEDTVIKAKTDVTVSENALQVARLDYEVLHSTTTVTRRDGRTRWSLGAGCALGWCTPAGRPSLEISASAGIGRHQLSLGLDLVNLCPRLGWQYQIWRN